MSEEKGLIDETRETISDPGSQHPRIFVVTR